MTYRRLADANDPEVPVLEARLEPMRARCIELEQMRVHGHNNQTKLVEARQQREAERAAAKRESASVPMPGEEAVDAERNNEDEDGDDALESEFDDDASPRPTLYGSLLAGAGRQISASDEKLTSIQVRPASGPASVGLRPAVLLSRLVRCSGATNGWQPRSRASMRWWQRIGGSLEHGALSSGAGWRPCVSRG